MRRLIVAVVLLAGAASVEAAAFERYLKADDPTDQQIAAYVARARAGTASSVDLTQLGVLLFEKGFPGDAEDFLHQALKVDKHNYEAAYRLGVVLQTEGKRTQAIRAYRKVVKVRPGYGPAQFMLAFALEKAGRRHDAIEHYAAAYRHAPELADPQTNPLVLDSQLQAEVRLRTYARDSFSELAKVQRLSEWDVELLRRVEAELVKHPAATTKAPLPPAPGGTAPSPAAVPPPQPASPSALPPA